jgi:hypothetical protein
MLLLRKRCFEFGSVDFGSGDVDIRDLPGVRDVIEWVAIEDEEVGAFADFE